MMQDSWSVRLDWAWSWDLWDRYRILQDATAFLDVVGQFIRILQDFLGFLIRAPWLIPVMGSMGLLQDSLILKTSLKGFFRTFSVKLQDSWIVDQFFRFSIIEGSGGSLILWLSQDPSEFYHLLWGTPRSSRISATTTPYTMNSTKLLGDPSGFVRILQELDV